jgi:hypothetical protein
MKAKKYAMGGYGTQQVPAAAQTQTMPTQASSMPMMAPRKPTMMAKGGMAMCGASVPPAQKRK